MENYQKNKRFRLPSYLEGEKTRSFTTLILTLIALSFFGFLAINPTLSTIVQLKKQLSDNQYVDQKLGEKITNLSSLQRKYKELAPDIPLLESAIPQNPNVPLLLAQIQSIVSSSKLSLLGLQAFSVELTQKTREAKAYSSFAFSLDVNGSYSDILSTISKLTQFNRIITIENLSINQRTGNQTEATIRGRAYFKK